MQSAKVEHNDGAFWRRLTLREEDRRRLFPMDEPGLDIVGFDRRTLSALSTFGSHMGRGRRRAGSAGLKARNEDGVPRCFGPATVGDTMEEIRTVLPRMPVS